MGIMGLFSNKKKPCPICGEGTPRLFATKIVDETPVCSDCGKKISMAETKLAQLSVEELKEHLIQREENAKQLEEMFRPNHSVDITWTSLNIDEENQLFTLPLHNCGDIKNPPIFAYEELTGYELHDSHGLIEICHRGDAAPRITSAAYAPIILDSDRTYVKRNRQRDISRDFKLYLYLSNPCWDKVEADAGNVSARESEFPEEYIAFLERFYPVTFALAAMMDIDATTYARDTDDIAEELKKFEELLDGGVITEEEFNEKKKQLLEI